MALTKLGKGIVAGLGVIVVGALATGQVENTQQIVKLQNQKSVIVNRTIIVTPTTIPTATPSAVKIFTPAKASNSATRGVK